jgi:hypothetical protein
MFAKLHGLLGAVSGLFRIATIRENPLVPLPTTQSPLTVLWTDDMVIQFWRWGSP